MTDYEIPADIQPDGTVPGEECPDIRHDYEPGDEPAGPIIVAMAVMVAIAAGCGLAVLMLVQLHRVVTGG